MSTNFKLTTDQFPSTVLTIRTYMHLVDSYLAIYLHVSISYCYIIISGYQIISLLTHGRYQKDEFDF